MPTFDTPRPISLSVEIVAGRVDLIASDRVDTSVHVRPTHESRQIDIRVAAQTHVAYTDGQLQIQTPPRQMADAFLCRVGSVHVTVELPAGSEVTGKAMVAAFRCSGQLGRCEIDTSTGAIQVDRAETVDLHTSTGAISVDHVAGQATVASSTGAIHLRQVDGATTVRNSAGKIIIDRAAAAITATTSSSAIRVGEAAGSPVTLTNSSGTIDIGIQAGIAARLDVATRAGKIRNYMDASDGPDPDGKGIEVYARSSSGSIVIHRSTDK